MRPWQGGGARRRLRSAVLFVGLGQLGLYAAMLGIDAPADMVTLTYYVAPVAALAIMVSEGLRMDSRMRAGVLLLAASVALWIAGDVGYSAFGGEPPAWVEIPYYVGYLTIAAAIPLVGLPKGARPDWQSLMDGGAVFVVVASLGWRFLITPLVGGSEGVLETLLVAGYPVADLAVLAMLVGTVYQRDVRAGSGPFMLLAGAACIWLATDVGFAVWSINAESVPASSVLDLGWLAGYWLFGLMPLVRASEAPRKQRAWVRSARLGLPYFMTFPFAAIAFADASNHGGVPILLGGLVAAVTLIIARQWMTLAENARLHEQLKEMAGRDSLTGLLNHKAWWEVAQRADARAIAVVDIDRFKRINDHHGHLAGDDVLAEVGRRLAVGFGDALAVGRVGGEEFAVLFAEPPSRVAEMCQRVVLSMAEAPVALRTGAEIAVSVSMGLAGVAGDGTGEERVVAAYGRADESLYEAKAQGRRRLAVA